MLNIIQDLKAWFSKEDGKEFLNVRVDINDIAGGLQYDIVEHLKKEIVDRIAAKFLEEEGAGIRTAILKDPHFADKVYNAIVLKVAKEYKDWK